MKEKLIHKFIEIFGHSDHIKTYFSPGRVNLIGEHIDYSGGLVFPAAINLGTYGAISLRNDQIVRMYSLNFIEQGIIETNLTNLEYQVQHGWSNYVKGVLQEVIKRAYTIDLGFDVLIYGDLPTASGLSSSASLELLIAFSINELFDLKIKRKELALLSQYVENHYMHMHCGIMDQLVIAEGVKNRALLMNTKTLEFVLVEAKFDSYAWIIMNTNYQRKTTDSKYNERRNESELALNIIKQHYKIETLCELTVEELYQIESYFINKTLFKRAKHAISEQQRVMQAKEALEKQNPLLFAKLLNQSHESLKFDYEVTGFHLDQIVGSALTHKAIGARVTGAGFGGCAIALVKTEHINDFIFNTKQDYFKHTGLHADFYQVSFSDGVCAF